MNERNLNMTITKKKDNNQLKDILGENYIFDNFLNENKIEKKDLYLIRNIISRCSLRGVFKGSELEDIGRLYNKVSKYLL